jgi:hypothetical protein
MTIKPTCLKLEGMGACRLYGSLRVNKVASNLHITSAGHGYGYY